MLWTPPGQFSYPNLAHPDERPEYGDGAYKTDLLIRKPDFKKYGDDLKDAVLTVGRAAFGSKFDLKGSKYRSPFYDTDEDDRIEDERQKGAILIRAKARPNKNGVARQPKVVTPKFDPETGRLGFFTQEEIEEIKGGDWGKLYVAVFPYTQSGGGVTFGLNGVQFWKKGEAFGQGLTKLLESTEELEVDDEMDEEDDAPPAKSSRRKASRDEDEDEDERPKRKNPALNRDEDHDDDEEPRKTSSKRKARDEDEDEDEAPPVKKTKRLTHDDDEDDAPPVKRGRKARDEDEDEEDERPSRKAKKSRSDDDDDLF